jgi:hypothetical protein
MKVIGNINSVGCIDLASENSFRYTEFRRQVVNALLHIPKSDVPSTNIYLQNGYMTEVFRNFPQFFKIIDAVS